jgi:TolA-binding protein
MKKLGLFLLVALVCAPLRAEESKAVSALRSWFKHLKEGLADSSVSEHYQRKQAFAAVAAVRGAAQDSVDPKAPAFKSSEKTRRSKELRGERQELTSAVDLILAGKLDEGQAGLDAFIKAHPKSPLLADAKQAREKMKELEAPAPEKKP